MPFLYDPSRDINMLQSTVSQGMQQRQQYGQQAFTHSLNRMNATTQAWNTIGGAIGTTAAKYGTYLAGGDPNDPTKFGQGWLNTKLGIKVDNAIKAKNAELLKQQNAAAAVLEAHTGGPKVSAGATGGITPDKFAVKGGPNVGILGGAAAALASGEPVEAKDNFWSTVAMGAKNLMKAAAGADDPPPTAGATTPPTTGATTPPTGGVAADTDDADAVASAMAHTFAGTTTPSGATISPTTKVTSAQGSVATATVNREAAEQEVTDAKRAVSEATPGTPEYEAAVERLQSAHSNLADAIKGQSISKENLGMADAQSRGNATALWSNGTTDINVISFNGRPRIVATMNGETVQIDSATAEAIMGITNKNEALTNVRLQRQQLTEAYEQSKYNADMQNAINRGVGTSYLDSFLGEITDPQFKRQLSPNDAEAQETVNRMLFAAERLRPYLDNMPPDQVKQILSDIMGMSVTGSWSQMEAHANSVAQLQMNGYGDSLKGFIKSSGFLVRDLRDQIDSDTNELADLNVQLGNAKDALAEAKEVYNQDHAEWALANEGSTTVIGAEPQPPSEHEVTALGSQITTVGNRIRTTNRQLRDLEDQMQATQYELLGLWNERYGHTKDIFGPTAYSGDPLDPATNIINSVLHSKGYFQDGQLDFDRLNELEAEEFADLAGDLQRAAAKAGWSNTTDDPMMWAESLKVMGANADEIKQRLLQYDADKAIADAGGGQGGGGGTGGGQGGGGSTPLVVMEEQNIWNALDNQGTGGDLIQRAREGTLSPNDHANFVNRASDILKDDFMAQGIDEDTAEMLAQERIGELGWAAASGGITGNYKPYDELSKEEWDKKGGGSTGESLSKEQIEWLGGYENIKDLEYLTPDGWVPHRSRGNNWSDVRKTSEMGKR